MLHRPVDLGWFDGFWTRCEPCWMNALAVAARLKALGGGIAWHGKAGQDFSEHPMGRGLAQPGPGGAHLSSCKHRFGESITKKKKKKKKKSNFATAHDEAPPPPRSEHNK